MYAILILLLSFTAKYAVDGNAKLSANLNCDLLGVNFYEDIGCKASTNKHDRCPNYYTCPQIPPKEGQCVYGSRTYLNGDMVAESNPCVSCSCFANNKTAGDIFCFIEDCPTPIDPEPSCNLTRELDQCCSTKTICPSPNNQICKVGNNTYKEGEIFQPEGTCWFCSCQKGFKEGVYKEPNCIRQTCGLHTGFKEDLQKRCSPIYNKSRPLCCPKNFICPEHIKNIKVKPSNQTGDSKTCVLGDLKVQYNKEIFLTYENCCGIQNTTCTCKLPPYLTCIN